MGSSHNKVIGYFAYTSPIDVFCSGAACIIAGSYEAMQRYLAEVDPHGQKASTIKKTRFGEILNGLKLGAAYAFDAESYRRFSPLARKIGLPVAGVEAFDEKPKDAPFLTVQLAHRW